jgi:hypothetical protein
MLIQGVARQEGGKDEGNDGALGAGQQELVSHI